MGFSRSLYRIFIVLGAVHSIVACQISHADDVSFSPRYDGEALDAEGQVEFGGDSAEVLRKSRRIYSFSRFAALVSLVCDGLAHDQRAGSLSTWAADGAVGEEPCPTCRSLLNEFASGCRNKLTPPSNREKGASLATVPYPPRYPSASTLDATSRLAQALYERDSESGEIFAAISRFATIVLGRRGMSRGELDYFGIFFAYFKSPWIGRGESEKFMRRAQEEESRALFE